MTLRCLPSPLLLILVLGALGTGACSKPAERTESGEAAAEKAAPELDDEGTASPAGEAAGGDTPTTLTEVEGAMTEATSEPGESTATAADAPADAAPAAPAVTPTPTADEVVVLETTAGPITIDLYEDKAPQHAANFKKLVKDGYYDGSPFHRVIEGFMAQGGGKWSKGGQVSDAGYTVPSEIVPGLTHRRGTVAGARMPDQVNPSRASSGSQFYICLGAPSWLDGQYSIFGEVVAGMENVDKITKGPEQMNGAVDPARATVITKARLEQKK